MRYANEIIEEKAKREEKANLFFFFASALFFSFAPAHTLFALALHLPSHFSTSSASALLHLPAPALSRGGGRWRAADGRKHRAGDARQNVNAAYHRAAQALLRRNARSWFEWRASISTDDAWRLAALLRRGAAAKQ